MKKDIQFLKNLLGKYRLFYVYLPNEIKFIKKYLNPSFNWKKWIFFRLNRKKILKKYLGPTFNWSECCRYNPYYLKYGFKFPMYEFEYYAANSGVKSDLYFPEEFMVRYIYPYMNFKKIVAGYTNKCMIDRMLDINNAKKNVDVLTPENIAFCDNGRFFRGGSAYELCTCEEAIQTILASTGDLIVKPALSSHGNGIMLLSEADKNEMNIRNIFEKYRNNFVIQKKVIQHPELAKLNPSSVNTMRIATYQDFTGKVKILYSTLRFGAKGSICDNADPQETHNLSGGFCAIKPDGTLERKVHHLRTLETTVLSEEIVDIIPFYEKVQKAVLFLHTRFPHFSLIAWDVTVTPEVHPVIIEYNFRPGLATCQLVHGPMFGKEDMDIIMEQISKARIIRKSHYAVSFPSKESYWIE